MQTKLATARGLWIVPVAVAAMTRLASGQETAPAPAPGTATRLQYSGFVDGYFAYNFNRPEDHENWFAGVGTSANRDNELALNLAQVDLFMAPSPVGFHVAFGAGTGLDVVHLAEEETWRHVVQASIQYRTSPDSRLLIEAGIYPSHIGFEGLASKDNWNYTRSWLGEFSPYYQTGVKLAWRLGDFWSTQVHLLNGWQRITDNNRGKSLGWQLARVSDRFTLSFNGIVGPEKPDNDQDLRALFDTVAVWKVTPAWSLGMSVDVATEERDPTDRATWWGAFLSARRAAPGARTAFALRAETYDDQDGAISGTAQTLREYTATFEYRPAAPLIVKLEARYDRSDAAVFTSDSLDLSGAPLLEGEQLLLLVGAVVTF